MKYKQQAYNLINMAFTWHFLRRGQQTRSVRLGNSSQITC